MILRKFVALSFESEESLGKCLDILFQEEISFDLPGDMDVIIPVSTLDVVKRNLKDINMEDFNEIEVVSAADLPPQEIAELRRKNLGFSD